MDRRAWWATVHGVAKSGTRLKGLSSNSSSGQKRGRAQDLYPAERNTTALHFALTVCEAPWGKCVCYLNYFSQVNLTLLQVFSH